MPPAMLPILRRQSDPGRCWPSNAGPTPSTTGDPFGERTFPGHASGVDFHRGIDLLDQQDGVPTYSPINGCVIRSSYTHFQWDDDSNMEQFTEVDPNSKATFSRVTDKLRIVGKNDGTVSFPSGLAQYRCLTPLSAVAGEWFIDLQLNATVSLTGKLVYGMYDPDNNEYALLEYDGSTFTVKGRDSGGAMTGDGTTYTPSARTWMRIRYDSTNGVIWQHSTDGSTWTDMVADASPSWTKQYPGFKVFVGWDPAGSGSDDTVDVAFFGWFDGDNIGRFGNWIEISSAGEKWLMMHHRKLLVAVGSVVRAGEQVGTTGKTGFDTYSGRIAQDHLHTEYIPNNKYFYANNDPLNPLDPDILPRTNGSGNVSVMRSTGNDPNGNDSHILTITCTRGTQQDFDMNEFSLTGNSGTRTINWNTRSGLDPADQDANNYNGVHFQPSAFNESSSSYVITLYFNKSAVGNTFSSAYVKDTDGTTLWSE